MGDFCEGLLENGRELKETEGVACGSSIENDGFVGEGFDLFEDFGEGHCFIDTRDLRGSLVFRMLYL